MDKPTIYLTHPVSAESKTEARRQGLRIIDAAFAPPEAAIYCGETGETLRQAGEPEAQPGDVPTREAIAEMKREDVLAALQAAGSDVTKGRIEELRAALASALYPEG